MAGPDTRCGYVPDSSEVADLGATCCWRPTWREQDRCLWHASVEEKPKRVLEDHEPMAGERLDGASLRGAQLSRTDLFADCTLIGADFTGATCIETDFTEADLRWTQFTDCNLAAATYTRANLEDTTFTRANLQGADLRRARMYRAVFANTHVDSETSFGEELVYETEMEAAREQAAKTELGEAAAWTYQQLTHLLSENAVVDRRHQFYIKSRDVRRRLAWLHDDYMHALKLEGARWVMHYGVSPWRVLTTSAVLILTSALLYPLTGGIRETAGEATLTYFVKDPTSPVFTYLVEVYAKSLYFSLVTFATLGYGDIQPVGPWARFIASIETILGSLLLALLVFVLTRSVD